MRKGGESKSSPSTGGNDREFSWLATAVPAQENIAGTKTASF
jgi:hypothetical protein